MSSLSGVVCCAVLIDYVPIIQDKNRLSHVEDRVRFADYDVKEIVH